MTGLLQRLQNRCIVTLEKENNTMKVMVVAIPDIKKEIISRCPAMDTQIKELIRYFQNKDLRISAKLNDTNAKFLWVFILRQR